MIRIVGLVLSLVVIGTARAEELHLTIGAPASKQLSGLLDYILPAFKTASNLSVRVVAIDPSDAVAIEKHGDTGQLLLDDRATEEKIVADGYGLGRRPALYNEFVIVGPSADPAGIRGSKDAGKAFAQIAAKGALFAGGGDDSSANRMELRLWKLAGIDRGKHAAWYRDLKQDRLAPLDFAAKKNAYTLTDRGTWANFKNRETLEVLSEGDPALLNVYSSILVSPEKQSRNPLVYAQIWDGWLTGKHGSEAITSYKINGEQIFVPCQDSAVALCLSTAQK
jgi:tungstate transport system substrate-binding protein